MDRKYKKMVKGMVDKQSRRRSRKKLEDWFLYILKCQDGTFYTGITKDLKRRLKMHNDGKASRYTRTRRPVKLLYKETCVGRAKALVRECAVKALARKKKEDLIKSQL